MVKRRGGMRPLAWLGVVESPRHNPFRSYGLPGEGSLPVPLVPIFPNPFFSNGGGVGATAVKPVCLEEYAAAAVKAVRVPCNWMTTVTWTYAISNPNTIAFTFNSLPYLSSSSSTSSFFTDDYEESHDHDTW